MRILPLNWMCFPSGSLFYQPQGSILHVCVLTNNLSSLQDTGSQARVKGRAALTQWVSSKVEGKSHRKRSLTGYSSWGRKESGMTEPVGMRTFLVEPGALIRRIKTPLTAHLSNLQEARGQPVLRRAEDESLDHPTSTGPDRPAPGKS